MQLNKEEEPLLPEFSGTCTLTTDVRYILYTENNWEAVQVFCRPFTIEHSKIKAAEGRAVIDLPTGNETVEYGMVLIRLGNKRILVFTPREFMDLFSIK
ncbi:hypothetical protein [Enterococcus sp. DIV0187]|uniref:hypothetical protein n=1 Tax=Enterococcus sp. DIV0187 TaxID=2774644 RepID=UPI003F2728B2